MVKKTFNSHKPTDGGPEYTISRDQQFKDYHEENYDLSIHILKPIEQPCKVSYKRFLMKKMSVLFQQCFKPCLSLLKLNFEQLNDRNNMVYKKHKHYKKG